MRTGRETLRVYRNMSKEEECTISGQGTKRKRRQQEESDDNYSDDNASTENDSFSTTDEEENDTSDLEISSDNDTEYSTDSDDAPNEQNVTFKTLPSGETINKANERLSLVGPLNMVSVGSTGKGKTHRLMTMLTSENTFLDKTGKPWKPDVIAVFQVRDGRNEQYEELVEYSKRNGIEFLLYNDMTQANFNDNEKFMPPHKAFVLVEDILGNKKLFELLIDFFTYSWRRCNAIVCLTTQKYFGDEILKLKTNCHALQMFAVNGDAHQINLLLSRGMGEASKQKKQAVKEALEKDYGNVTFKYGTGMNVKAFDKNNKIILN